MNFTEQFTNELLGGIVLPALLAWLIWAAFGAFLGSLLRTLHPGMKTYPMTYRQVLLFFIITLASIRFSQSLFNIEPTAFGAFVIGVTHNEVALLMLKKWLDKKTNKEEQDESH